VFLDPKFLKRIVASSGSQDSRREKSKLCSTNFDVEQF
jgi:hypothetical protein